MQGFMQGLWIYPEDTEVLGVACKSLLKALQPCYQKIALFSPIRPYDGGCEGLGENYSALRERVCEGLENLGIALHKPTNDNPGNGLVDLSQPDSKVKVLRIPTDEELEIALQAKEIVEKLK
ncbi:hypothetical protein [Helicobacter pylori]|uniref:hypothetical protein n=1 Tax=Helicobacter pylori TaxID=210 RepID=UPI001FD4D241|nr:hypothetical protein [Helicobacter pylori]UOS48461.1 hypothetical protein MPG81_02745 [Helicobacter pylori]